VKGFIDHIIPDTLIKAFADEMMLDIDTTLRWIVEYKKFLAL